jgi:hypothetical protein
VHVVHVVHAVVVVVVVHVVVLVSDLLMLVFQFHDLFVLVNIDYQFAQLNNFFLYLLKIIFDLNH